MNRRNFLSVAPALAASGLAAAPASDSKGRFRTAICAYSFRLALAAKTMTYDDLVRLAVDLDVDGLDVTVYWFPDTSNEFLLPLRRLAYRSGVELYSIAIRSNMCQPTRELQDKELGELKKWVDAAERLGAGHIRVFGGTVPKTSNAEEASSWVVEVLKRAAEYSGGKGIILGLENHGGITEKADTILSIVQRVNSPWVGINLDTGNFNSDPYGQMEKIASQAVNVQFKADIRDGGERQPSDWARILKMLARTGYKGYLSLEYEEKEDPAVAVPRLIRKLQGLIRQA